MEDTYDFESKKEIYQYLLDGGKIKHIFTLDIAYFRNDSLYTTGKSGLLENSDWKDWRKVKDPKWYEAIPSQGRLCWVGEKSNMMELIVKYDYYTEVFVSNLGVTYKKAVPLTNEEIKGFLFHEES